MAFVTGAPLLRAGAAPTVRVLGRGRCAARASATAVRTPVQMGVRLPGGGFPGFGNLFGGGGGGLGGGMGASGGDGGGLGGGASGGGRRGKGPAGGASGGGSTNPIQQFLVTYEGWLGKKPILTKALTSAVGFALGDILAQCFISSDAAFDWARFFRVASFGFLLHGTTGHLWYGKLDQVLPGTEAWKVAVKVAADQLLWAPVFTAMYFSYLGFAEGRSLDYIQTKIQNDTMAGVTASWKVWPIVHAVSFRFVPTELRILYINTIQIFYNIFLSVLGNKSA